MVATDVAFVAAIVAAIVDAAAAVAAIVATAADVAAFAVVAVSKRYHCQSQPAGSVHFDFRLVILLVSTSILSIYMNQVIVDIKLVSYITTGRRALSR